MKELASFIADAGRAHERVEPSRRRRASGDKQTTQYRGLDALSA
jgi:hypothetical protein